MRSARSTGTPRTRSTGDFTSCRDEMMRAMISTTTTTGSHSGIQRWLERSQSVRAIRHLPLAEDETGQQQRDGRVADDHQEPVAIERSAGHRGIEILLRGADRDDDAGMIAQEPADDRPEAAVGVAHELEHADDQREHD